MPLDVLEDAKVPKDQVESELESVLVSESEMVSESDDPEVDVNDSSEKEDEDELAEVVTGLGVFRASPTSGLVGLLSLLEHAGRITGIVSTTLGTDFLKENETI
jgi:DNA-directed RNA polymerase subunit H (RpoH/RPB5)